MNVQYVGPNLHLAPHAGFDDGQLTVVLAQDGEQNRLSEYLDNCLAGKPSPVSLTTYQGQHLQVEGEGFDIHIDDDIVPHRQLALRTNCAEFDVKVDPQSLELLLPTS